MAKFADQKSSLAAVNACLAVVGTIQVSRVLSYQASQKGSLEEAIKDVGRDLKKDASSLEQTAEKKATQ